MSAFGKDSAVTHLAGLFCSIMLNTAHIVVASSLLRMRNIRLKLFGLGKLEKIMESKKQLILMVKMKLNSRRQQRIFPAFTTAIFDGQKNLNRFGL